MKKLLISGTALGVILVAASVALAVGTNGSFETGITPDSIGFTTLYATDTTSIGGWTVDSGSVDYIGSYWGAADGARSVDLNGFTKGSISQTLTTIVGATYRVSFDLSGNPDSRPVGDSYYSPSLKVVRVSANGGQSMDYSYDTAASGNSLGNMMWQSEAYTFVATTTSTTLTFASQIDGAFGPALDNVSVAETPPTPSGTCPAGTTQSEVPLGTYVVDSASMTPVQSVTLSNGASYLFVSSGTWQNNNLNATDTEYASVDGWASFMDGYNITPWFLGANEFDLTINGAFVNWGGYSPAHIYSYLFTGNGAPASFMVFDGDSTVPSPSPNAGWYGDNSGSLSVAIYSCNPNASTPVVPSDKNQCKNGGWKTLVDNEEHRFKNQGDCVSFVATNGRNKGAGGN